MFVRNALARRLRLRLCLTENLLITTFKYVVYVHV